VLRNEQKYDLVFTQSTALSPLHPALASRESKTRYSSSIAKEQEQRLIALYTPNNDRTSDLLAKILWNFQESWRGRAWEGIAVHAYRFTPGTSVKRGPGFGSALDSGARDIQRGRVGSL